VINPTTLRSQFISDMKMGRRWRFARRPIYHITSHADIFDINAIHIDNVHEGANPMRSRGAARSASSARRPR
jgi:xanthine dehydrogenase YagR molybdenum-binding subunit